MAKDVKYNPSLVGVLQVFRCFVTLLLQVFLENDKHFFRPKYSSRRQ